MPFSFSRRSFVSAFGAGATGLCLPVLRTSEALAQPRVPKCLVVFFRPNGVNRPSWWPTGTEGAFQLGASSRPLEPWKKHLLFLKNLNMGTFRVGPGDLHQKGVGQLLTARELLPGPFKGNGMHAPAGWASGPSIDQVIANHLRVQSLDLNVEPFGRDVVMRISYSDRDRPRDPQGNPYTVYDSIFKSFVAPVGGSDKAQMERIRARRQSALDYVNGDVKALAARLPSGDRLRLDAHLAGLRALEGKLAALGGTSDAVAKCAAPTRPADGLAYRAVQNMPAVCRIQIDLLVAALACGVTRVASLMWARGVSFLTYPWLGIPDAHHELSHSAPGDAVGQGKLVKIDTWISEQFAYLLGKMHEAGLLESSATLLLNDLADGLSHSGNNVPWAIAGSAGGAFRPGRLVDCGGRNHNDLFVSLANAMGLPMGSFGDPSFNGGPLRNLS